MWVVRGLKTQTPESDQLGSNLGFALWQLCDPGKVTSSFCTMGF